MFVICSKRFGDRHMLTKSDMYLSSAAPSLHEVLRKEGFRCMYDVQWSRYR